MVLDLSELRSDPKCPSMDAIENNLFATARIIFNFTES